MQMQMQMKMRERTTRERTERAMSLDDVPINGRSDRTWEALIALHLDGDGADGFDGSDGFARGTTDAEDEDVVTRGNQSDERLTTERRADRMAPRRTARTRSIECSMR